MNNNVLTYAEYQKRLKELKTPEDIASFAQELIAPALAGNMAPEKKEAIQDEPKDEAPEEPRKKRILLPKEKLYAIRKLQLVDANVISPWYDVVGNDTDVMVISLYAKGLKCTPFPRQLVSLEFDCNLFRAGAQIFSAPF